jgi:hypothetical protein
MPLLVVTYLGGGAVRIASTTTLIIAYAYAILLLYSIIETALAG